MEFIMLEARLWAQLLSCVRLFCDPMDCSPPGSSVHRIFQLEYCGADGHFLIWGTFSTQELNLHLLCLLHWLADSLPLSHLARPCRSKTTLLLSDEQFSGGKISETYSVKLGYSDIIFSIRLTRYFHYANQAYATFKSPSKALN